ncbi:MAG TPA: Y-family DNA polymerase [Candidatus Saccharimonadales bacterium]|nr:Y-family DNA polymerase [Candidatus Saccharimonadales bacterium]
MAAVKPIYALVDCNNFFVSCERVFRPDLWNKPVCVLSNNDGCIVARSNEVKAMGVKMGAPYFEMRDILTRNNVTLFSGNFALYGDFSQRVVQILKQESPNIEVYSVDESFLEISGLPIKDYSEWGRQLSARVFKNIGIPVSVGIAPSKTLAKAAADFAKKNPDVQGAFSVAGNDSERERLLRWLPVGDVWGVGWRTAPKLIGRGIRTAYDLSKADLTWAQNQLSIRGVKTVRELRGESCISLDVNDELQKTMTRSRSFGHTIRNYFELEAAIATFTAQAAAKLRDKKEIAGSITVFLYGSKHAEVRSGGSLEVKLMPPTNHTGQLINSALQGLQKVYDQDFGYKKAGVTLTNLLPESARQLELGADTKKLDKHIKLMQTVDLINRSVGARLVRHASEDPMRTYWFSRKQLKSPAYTTSWSELPVIKR